MNKEKVESEVNISPQSSVLKYSIYGLIFFMSLLLTAGYFIIPGLLEKALHQSLQDIGYEEIQVSNPDWSRFGSSIKLEQLQAKGESLPNIVLENTELQLSLTKVLVATLEAELSGTWFSGKFSVVASHPLWGEKDGFEIQLKDFPIETISSISQLQPYLPAVLKDIQLQGQLDLNMKGVWLVSGQSIKKLKGDINLKDFKAQVFSDYPKVRLGSLELKGLSYVINDAGKTKLEGSSLKIKGLNFPSLSPKTAVEPSIDAHSLVSIGFAEIKQVQWQEGKVLSVASVNVAQGEVRAEKDEQGVWFDWKLWSSAMPVVNQQNKNGEKVEAAEEMLPISIHNLQVKEVTIKFKDKSKKPVINIPIVIQDLSAQNVILDQQHQPLNWTANGFVGQHGAWQAKGSLSPLKPQLLSKTQLRIDSLDLSPLSGYTGASYGKGIRSGNLDLNLTVAIEQGALKAEGDLFARKVSLNNLKDVALSDSMMPLDSALDILKDSDDNITMQFLSEGRLDDPSFKLSGIWDKVLAKAATQSALYMVGQTLQPYMLVVTAGEFLYDQSKRINLKPLVFAQSDSTGAGAQPEVEFYVQKISDLLLKKTSLVLEICARYTQAEAESGEKLSLERSELISNKLKSLGLEAKRITSCLPELDESKKAKPRLELRLF